MHASVVNFFNPSHVFSRAIVRNGPLFPAVVRESVYHHSLALLTGHLDIQYAPLGECAGLAGACVLAMPASLRLRGSAQ
jgi:hypothetical protein